MKDQRPDKQSPCEATLSPTVQRRMNRLLPMAVMMTIFALKGLSLYAAEKTPVNPRPQDDPTEGDNLRTATYMASVDIPLSDSPVHEVAVKSADGVDLTFMWRRPKGNAVCPVIVFLHGGGKHAPLEKLERNLLSGSVQTRFLAKGFVVVECTRRPFWKSAGSGGPAGFYDAVKDTELILEKVRALPGVDKSRIALYGGSGGGILAIVTASQTDVACVIAGEPAIVVPLAPDLGERSEGIAYRSIMADPGSAFTGARKQEILDWMQKISCPVLLLQGKSVGLYKAIFEVLIPEMKKLGKSISVQTYPDVSHGFYFGGQRTGATPELLDTIVTRTIEFISAAATPAPTPPAQDSLKQAFADDFAVGVGGMLDVELNPAERELLFYQFNTITLGNCMKPAPIHPAEDRFQFAKADKLVDMARAGGLTVNAHTLIWHNQCPNWFFVDGDKPAGQDLVLKRMRTHIATVAGHFAGKVQSWDVVNEAIDDGKDDLRDSQWHAAIGDDYIAEAFFAARQADPKAELYYNDYGIERPAKRDKALRLIRDLKRRGAPIQGIGIQGHWQIDKIPFKEIEEAIIAFHEEGLQVMITELDVDMVPRATDGAEASSREQDNPDPFVNGLTPEAQRKLADQYAALFTLFLKHRDKITRVTFWGLHDGRSWLNHWPRGRTCTNHPLLWDRTLQPKPALSAVMELAQQKMRPQAIHRGNGTNTE